MSKYLEKHFEKARKEVVLRGFYLKMIFRVGLIGSLVLLGNYTCQSYREWNYIHDNLGYLLEPGELEKYREENIKNLEELLSHKTRKDYSYSSVVRDLFVWEDCVKEKICEYDLKHYGKCDYQEELESSKKNLYEYGECSFFDWYKKECKNELHLPDYILLSDEQMRARIDSLSDKKLIKRCYVKEKYGSYEHSDRASRHY